MARIFENTYLVNRLSNEDPECNFVNKMMEMPADILRDLLNNTQYPDTLHGIVPTYKLPSGYSYGDPHGSLKDKESYEKIDNRNGISKPLKHSFKSNSSSTLKEYEFKHDRNQANEKLVETVREDLILSEDEAEQVCEDISVKDFGKQNHINPHFQLLLDTLDACTKKMPILKSMKIFPKYYRPNRTDNIKSLSQEDLSSKSETLVDKQCEENLMKFINLISESAYKSNMAPSFKTFYNLVNSNNYKKRKLSPEKVDIKSVSPPKIPKLSQIEESNKVSTPESYYTCICTPNGLEMSINIIPKLSIDLFDNLKNLIKNGTVVQTEINAPILDSKPKYVSQESLPFTKTESIPKKENKGVHEQSIESLSNQISDKPTDEFLCNQISTDNIPNPVRKPEAAAKQYFANHSNYSNLSTNTKVAVVAGKVNVTQPSIQCKLDRKQSLHSLSGADKESSDSNLVIQGLMAMRRMRSSYKKIFIARMKNLDNTKWLKEVQSLKEKANNCKTQLDYAPQIMVYIRKNLFHNYSLEVKSDFGTSHLAYLENAAIIKQSCALIAHIYNDHLRQIKDENSSRTWNINLVKHFTVIMCHRLSAILQYRAFRNVADNCRKIRDTLIGAGLLDPNKGGHTPSYRPCGSPMSGLSSYSSPGVCDRVTSGGSVPLVGDGKSLLQQYVDQMAIINSSYYDWQLAEKLHTSFCSRSSRHEESWADFETKIIEKTGGVVIATIDESVPFVIKFLEGYINFMNEFMRRNL